MTRLSIDYGIDLGTTNSVVAVRDKDRVLVIPNDNGSVSTPSAVHINKRGRTYVGSSAKARASDDPQNTAVVFKRTMGQGDDARKHFQASGKSLSPVELSAEVLMSLRADIRDKRGEEPREIVITYPADFTSEQCDATRKAAGLAGFSHCELLLEPVAAGIAYGVDRLEEGAYWLIYDFGGGTFDAALIHLDDGLPVIVSHAGNNFLGGSDVDRDIAVQYFVPALKNAYNLPEFNPNDAFWKEPLAKLIDEAEKAKIRVCRKREPADILTDNLCKDLNGDDVDLEFILTPEQVEKASRPYTTQTLEACHKCLEQAGIAAANVDRVVMVGGSTLNPWVREAIETELGRPLEISIDPMTVVAEGAALYASSISVEVAPEAVPEGNYTLNVVSDLTSEESPVSFLAKVVPPEEGATAGLTLELVDEVNAWSSGRIPVRDGGNVRAEVHIAEQGMTEINVQLRRDDGTLLACTPELIAFRAGTSLRGIESPLNQNIGVGLASEQLDVVLKRGSNLPTKGRTERRTNQTLRKGDDSKPLRIPLYEGANTERAHRNRLLIAILVHGKDVPCDIPAGSEVEVELSCDRNRTLNALVIFPTIDYLEVNAEVKLDDTMPKPLDLRKLLDRQVTRFDALRKDAEEADSATVRKVLAVIQEQDFPRRIGDLLNDEANMDARGNAERLIRDFATELDRLEDIVQLPKLIAEAEQVLESTKEVVETKGNVEHQNMLRQLESAWPDLRQSRAPVHIRRFTNDCRALLLAALQNDLGFWISMFESMKNRRHKMRDQQAASMLIRQGDNAIANNDIDGLKAVVNQLRDLLVDDEPRPGPESVPLSNLI